MPARQVICFHRVLDENRPAVQTNKLSFAVVVLLTEQGIPAFFEVIGRLMELPDQVTNQFVALRPEQVQRRRICFQAGSAVIQNQDAVQGIVEYGLEFAFRGVEQTGGLAMLPADENQKAGMQDDRSTEGDKHECE